MSAETPDTTSWDGPCRLAEARAEAEAALDPAILRPLEPGETRQLELQGNRCADWNRVVVTPDFSAEAIFGSEFRGDVRLGRFAPNDSAGGDSASGDSGPSGIYDSSIEDAAVASRARVFRCGLVRRAFIAEGAVLESVGRLGMSGAQSRFGNGTTLFDGPLFSRRLRIAAGLPFEWAAWATGPDGAKPENRALLEAAQKSAESHAAAMESNSAYVGPGATVRCTPVVEDCWIGPYVEIDGANSLRASTVWGEELARTRIADGAHLAGALVGPGCTVAQQCTVESSLFTGYVQVGHQAIVKGSVVGANARLAECEINDSVLGPFTTAIHHALVISAWWPEGRGNVGYGANVGSNHTGRAPDQEIWIGEGMFFGLGSNIKFPCNFREAPYSIIAAGVDVLPQKVTFPFSLIATPFLVRTEGVPPAYNEIRPGWSIVYNAYGLARLERKLAERDRTGTAPARLAVFRPEIVKSLCVARDALDALGPKETGAYTEIDLAGLGKNAMTDAGREEGLHAYRLGARHGAAVAILNALDAIAEAAYERGGNPGDDALAVLAQTFESMSPIFQAENSQALVDSMFKAERDWLEAVIASRRKDEKRGAAVIDDYAARHVSVADDPIVIGVRETLERREERSDDYMELVETHLFSKAKA